MPEESSLEQGDSPEATGQAADAQQGEQKTDRGPEYAVDVQDAGLLKKKVTVTVPRARIDSKYEEMFGELGRTAQIPGFRIGRAPRQLIEKRFGKDISTDVRDAMVADSLAAAIKKTGMKTLGEPEVDLDKIELPEQGDMTYAFEVEVMPEFQLPPLEGAKVNKVLLEVTDERIDGFLDELRQSRSRFEATEDAAAEGDMVLAGARISGEGLTPLERPGLNLRVAPGQIEGLPLVDLGKALTGKRAGQKAELKAKVSDAHPNKDWHGKELVVEVEISQVRRRVLPPLDDEFARSLGFGSLEELRRHVTARAKQRAEAEVRSDMRNQICQYLLDNTSFDLPEGAAGRHAERVLQRHAVDLLLRGVPRDEIESHITELQSAAADRAKRDVKLSFVLQKIAEETGVTVDQGEVNARIAALAAEQNRRPERLRQRLAQEGTLGSLEDVLRQEKVLDALLEKAVVTEVAPEAAPKKSAQAETARPARSQGRKKPARKSAGARKPKSTPDGGPEEQKK
jgi:trigger factor